MFLYHVEVGFPAWYRQPTGTIRPNYGHHSRFEAQVDRYGKVQLPETLDLSACKVIEIGVENGRVAKTLFRTRLDERRDICIVITDTGFVKTVWVNLRTDRHKTLDRSRYTVPGTEGKNKGPGGPGPSGIWR